MVLLSNPFLLQASSIVCPPLQQKSILYFVNTAAVVKSSATNSPMYFCEFYCDISIKLFISDIFILFMFNFFKSLKMMCQT